MIVPMHDKYVAVAQLDDYGTQEQSVFMTQLSSTNALLWTVYCHDSRNIKAGGCHVIVTG